MRQNKTLYWVTLLVGLLIIFSALIRALSVNNLLIAASTGDISTHYSVSVVIDWALSSTMMLLVGVWVLFLASPLRKGQRRAWWQGIIISLVFMAFGGFFWYHYPKSLHLPGFALLGLLMFIPLIIFAGRFGKPRIEK